MSKSVLGHLQLLLSADSAQITSDLGKARAAVKTATAGMQGDASKALQVVTTQVQGLGPALRGTQQATAAAMQGLQLFGTKGSAAVAGLANGISGLLSGGFTPLGLAISGATAAIGYFVGQSEKAEKSSVGLAQSAADTARALESQFETYKKIRDLQATTEASRSGMSLEERATQNRLESAKLRLESIGQRIEAADVDVTRLAHLEKEERLRGNLHNQFAYELQDARKRLDALVREDEDTKSLIRDLERLSKARTDEAQAAEDAAKAKAAAKAFLARQDEFDGPDNRYKGFGGLRLSDEEQRKSDADDKVRRDLEKAGEEGRAHYFFQEQMAEIEAQQRAVNGEALERIQKANEKATKIKPTEAQRTERNFATTLSNLGDMRAALDAVGESAANALTGGVVDALDKVTQGAMTAKDAFRALASDFARMASKMAMQAALANAFGSIFGVASPTTGPSKGGWVPPATTGAHGGTWRVGGIGGLDSQLVQMRLSPGEMVKVTDGANSRGGDAGPVYVDLSVRPPAVIADDVLARSSREARAAVVSSAVRRGGRRAMRARD